MAAVARGLFPLTFLALRQELSRPVTPLTGRFSILQSHNKMYGRPAPRRWGAALMPWG